MQYYAVRNGRKTGIFTTWEECKESVHKFSGAVFKGFQTLEEANNYLNENKATCSNKANVAYVDGSYNAITKVYGYGGIIQTEDGREIIFNGSGDDAEMASMRNVAGEILGATKAMELALENGLKELTICYDYTGIEYWATGNWKATKRGTIEYHRKAAEISKQIDVNFVKVKAHSGVELNELVDKLAKEAVGIY